MAAKRLRGAALDHAMLQGPEPVTSKEVEHSALASKLLSLWSVGTLSATMVRELAHLALLDGASHTELATVANTGTCGSNVGNCHRDLLKAFCERIEIDEPHLIPVPAVDPKSS